MRARTSFFLDQVAQVTTGLQVFSRKAEKKIGVSRYKSP